MRLIQKDGEFLTPAEYKERYGELSRRGSSSGVMIINKSFDAYESPITGEIISTHRQRSAEMKQHGCVDYEPSLKNEITDNIKRDEAKLEKMVDETVEHEISTMSARQRETLEAELKSGADIQYERLAGE